MAQSIKVTKGADKISPYTGTTKDESMLLNELVVVRPSCGYHTFINGSSRIAFVLTGEDNCIITLEQIEAV